MINARYIDYCRRDVLASFELFEALLREYERHPISLRPTLARSPASIAKAYLDAMGITPFLEQNPRFARELLGKAMVAYVGGRVETRLRRLLLPVTYLDFLSMYPTVNANMGLWRFFICQHIEVSDTTETVRGLVERIDVDDLFRRETWSALTVLCLVEPAGEVLPTRGMYQRGGAWQIGINPLTSRTPLWMTLADVIAAKVLGGRAPAIRKAIRLTPVGTQDGLRPVMLLGEIEVDPARDDFFTLIVEARTRLKQRRDFSESEREWRRFLLKVIVNAASYGITAEMNASSLGSANAQVDVYALEDPFRQTLHGLERPGRYCFPPLAAFITGAARLMLALLERSVSDLGGTHVMADTDSMAIVSNKHGGLIPCPGGQYTAPTGEAAVLALTHAQIDAIIERFNALSPYDADAISSISHPCSAWQVRVGEASVCVVQRPDNREIRAEERLLNQELYRAAREPVLDLVTRLQQAQSVEDKMMLHRDLLIQFGARQDATDETLPQFKEAAANEIRKLVKREPKPIDQIREQQAILTRIEEQALVATAVQHVLREVGDGLAWKALRYDRRAFTILGDGRRVGRLASGVGRQAELIAIGDLWEEDRALAIHNDLTNCMRHGDLTIVREIGDALSVTLAEVKAGQGNLAPQLERLEHATRLLTDGRVISADEDSPTVHVTVVPGEYSTYLAQLPALLAEAREVGFAWGRLHACLLVGVVDYRIWGRDIQGYSSRSQARRLEVGWAPDQPDTIGRTASMKRMNDRRDNFTSIAPYTIFPLSADDITDLIMGFIDILVSLSYPDLERALSQDGVRTTVYRHPAAAQLFLRADSPSAGADVPAVDREQMMTELTTPDSLLRLIKHVLAQNEARPEERYDRKIVAFEIESSTWSPQ